MSANNAPVDAGLLELEYANGYTGKYLSSLVYHPRDANALVYSIGATLVIGDLNDP